MSPLHGHHSNRWRVLIVIQTFAIVAGFLAFGYLLVGYTRREAVDHAERVAAHKVQVDTCYSQASTNPDTIKLIEALAQYFSRQRQHGLLASLLDYEQELAVVTPSVKDCAALARRLDIHQ